MKRTSSSSLACATDGGMKGSLEISRLPVWGAALAGIIVWQQRQEAAQK